MLLALEADRLTDGNSRGRTAMLGALTFDVGYLGVSAAPRSVSSVTGGYLPDGRLLIANDGTLGARITTADRSSSGVSDRSCTT